MLNEWRNRWSLKPIIFSLRPNAIPSKLIHFGVSFEICLYTCQFCQFSFLLGVIIEVFCIMYLCIVTEMIDALQAFQTTTCILGLPSAWCCLQLALCFVNCLTLLLKESFITEAAFYIYLSATLFFKHTITRLFYLNYLWLQYQLSQVGYINFTKKNEL